MSTVKIYLKGGQMITLKETEVIKQPGSRGVGFSIPRQGARLNFLDQEEIAAVTSEDE